MALRDSQRVRHTKNSHGRLAIIISQLQSSLTQEEQFIEKLVELSKINVPETVSDEFILNIIGGDVANSRGKNRVNDFKRAITTEYETHGNTAYALFNATTRFTNYMMSHKSVEAKRESLIHGSAYTINNKGLELISETYTPLYTPELSL
jgi:hypothetical protein